MIAAILVAMAVGISTTTPRTTAESGSTESGRDNNLEYRARARGYDGALNNNKNNNTAADNNNVWTLPVEGGDGDSGDRRGNCSRRAGERKDPPAERRKPRREKGATLPWRASMTTAQLHQCTEHTSQPEACESTRGWTQERCPQQPEAQEPRGTRHGPHSGPTDHTAAMLWRSVQGKEGARDKRREAKPNATNPCLWKRDSPPKEKKNGGNPPIKKK